MFVLVFFFGPFGLFVVGLFCVVMDYMLLDLVAASLRFSCSALAFCNFPTVVVISNANTHLLWKRKKKKISFASLLAMALSEKLVCWSLTKNNMLTQRAAKT